MTNREKPWFANQMNTRFYLVLTGGGTAPLHLFCAVGAIHDSCSGNIGACRHLYNCLRPAVILTIFFCLLPMAGNKIKRAHVYWRNKETGRDAYIDDTAYRVVWTIAEEPLRDAFDLAYLPGQHHAMRNRRSSCTLTPPRDELGDRKKWIYFHWQQNDFC